MALLWAFLLQAAAPSGPWASDGLYQMAQIGITINLVLMALNLLPIPPLDGGRIAVGLLPDRAAECAGARRAVRILRDPRAVADPGCLEDLLGPIYSGAYPAVRVSGL